MFDDGEKNLVDSYWLIHEDGLLDIFIGVVILGIVLDIHLDTSYWFISLALMGYFIALMSGKEVITRPRMHHFDIAQERRNKLITAITAGIIWMIVGAIFGVLTFLGLSIGATLWVDFLETYLWLILAWFVAFGLSLFAYFDIGGKRFFTYALLISLASTIRQILVLSVIPFIFLSAAMLLIPGLFLLIRFLLRYPK